MTNHATRTRILLTSGSMALSLALLLPSAAQADCLPNVDGSIVTCQAIDADGYTAGDNVTIIVNSGASVLDTLTVGFPGQVNNEGIINTGTGTAISTGGGAGVANATAGVLTGNTVMGATIDTQVNSFVNLGTVTGDLDSAGALDFTNSNSFTGNLSSDGTLMFLNDSAGTFAGDVSADGDTIFTNDGSFTGDLTLGDGDDFVFNTGTFTGNIDMGAGTNVVGFEFATEFPTSLTADADGDNSLVLFGSGGETLTLAPTNFDLLYKTGTGTWTLGGAVTLDDEILVDEGVLETPDADFIGANTVTNDATISFTNLAGGTFSGDMSGEGAVTIGGGGTAVTIFSGTNSYTGGTTITQGTLQVTGGAALADDGEVSVDTLGTLDVAASETIGTLSGDGAVLLSGGDLTVADGAFDGIISGTGGLVKESDGTLTLTGANSYAGGTIVNGGTLVGDATSLQGDIVNDADLVFDQALAGAYTGDLSGTGTLTKTGAGTLTLSGSNSYTGATTVAEGTLSSNATGIGTGSAVTVDAGATLLFTANATVGSLAGDGDLSMAGLTLTTGGDNSSTDFAGTATAAGITKTGTGTLTLSGSGTLTGALTLTGGTLAIGGTYSAATASAASGTTLDILADGDLTADVTGATGSTIRVNGTLTGDLSNGGTLYGSGTINGALTNDGNLRPGNSPGLLTVNGSFVQGSTGTLNAELTPTATAGTGYDQVFVTGAPGTASLDGMLALAPASGLYVAGTTYDVVLAEGGITGDFDTITGATISPFISFADTGVVTVTGGEAYRLTVARTSYATGIGSSATPNQVAVATGFQGLVAGATGDAATLVTQVDNMTAAQAQAFFDEASPEGYGAYATALVDQGDLFTRQVGLHLADEMKTGAWVRLYGQDGEGKTDGFRYGTDHDVTGVAGGIDIASNGTYHFGVALGYSEGPFHSELGNSDGDGKSWQVGAYGGYMAGPVSANVQFAYIDTSADVTRSVGSRFASANVDGHLWKVVGTLGYDMSSGGATIRPFVGVDYSNGKIKGFGETGANAASLTVDAIDADETDLMAGIDLAGKMGGLTPYARLAYRYNIDGGNRDVSAIFNGNSATAFTVSAIESGKSQVDVDAGLRFNVGPAVGLFLGYQGMFRNDLTTHGVNAGIRFAF